MTVALWKRSRGSWPCFLPLETGNTEQDTLCLQLALHHIPLVVQSYRVALTIQIPEGASRNEGHTPSRQVLGSTEKQKGGCCVNRERATTVHPSPCSTPSGARILSFWTPGLVLPLGLCTADMKKTVAHAEVSFGSSSPPGHASHGKWAPPLSGAVREMDVI